MPAKPAKPAAAPLTILTFNLLAPCYKRMYTAAGLERPDRESDHEPLWTARLDALLALLLAVAPRPDLIALQEVWYHPPYLARLEAALAPLFHIHYAKRPGPKEDGLATLVLRASPAIRASRRVASFPLADADRVGLAVSAHVAGGVELLVVNAHLTFPHCFISRVARAEQASTLVSFVAQYLAGKGSNVYAVVLGDFNGDGDSAACKRMFAGGFVNCYEKVNGAHDRPATHLNHRKEQVFVDHLFLTSNGTVTASTDSLAVLDSLPSPRRRRRVSALRDDEPVSKGATVNGTRRSRQVTDQTRTVSPSPVAIRDMNKACMRSCDAMDSLVLEKPSCFKPIKTTVYPEQFSSEAWPTEFILSDHRPVAVQFSLAGGP